MTNISSADISPKGSNHTLQLDRRRHASIAGVTDVLSFHETEVALKIDSGMMYIAGDGLHIAKLLLEEGRLEVDGQIDSVVYETLKKSTKRIINWKWSRK